MNGRLMSVVSVFLLVFLVASNSLFVIKDSERGIKKQFGRVIDQDLKPGLGFKVPFFQEVQKFDARIHTFELSSQDYITREKKRLVVDSYVMWQVSNVGKFYTAPQGSIQIAQNLLTGPINEGLRNQFGERAVQEVVSGEREQIMVELTGQMNTLTQEQYGIQIIDIRIKKIEYPPDVTATVHRRMQQERAQEAQEHRSKGEEAAEGIRALADGKATVLKAEAYQQAEILRGKGDAQAAAIYAAAFGADPEFYQFTRSLGAYQKIFQGGQNMMVLSADNEFFRYLETNKKN
jgi:membrane protease subunit HflC